MGAEEILTVKGTYTYTDNRGKLHDVSYIADDNGFRWLKHDEQYQTKKGRSLLRSESENNDSNSTDNDLPKGLDGSLLDHETSGKNPGTPKSEEKSLISQIHEYSEGLKSNREDVPNRFELRTNLPQNFDANLNRLLGSTEGQEGLAGKLGEHIDFTDNLGIPVSTGAGPSVTIVEGITADRFANSFRGNLLDNNNKFPPNLSSPEHNDSKYRGYSKSQLADLELIEKLKKRKRGPGFKGYIIKNTATTNSIRYYWKEGSLKKLYTDCQKEDLPLQVKLFCDSQIQ